MKFSELVAVLPMLGGGVGQLDHQRIDGCQADSPYSLSDTSFFKTTTIQIVTDHEFSLESEVMPPTLHSLYVKSVGIREMRGNNVIVKPPSGWRDSDLSTVATAFSYKTYPEEDLRSLYKYVFYQPGDGESYDSYDRLARNAHQFVQIAIYSGLNDQEINSCVGLMFARSSFGEKIPEDKAGWLGLDEKVHDILTRQVIRRFPGGKSDWEVLDVSVKESLIMLELHAKATDIFKTRMNREPNDIEQTYELVNDVSRAIFFASNHELGVTYRKEYDDLHRATETVTRLEVKSRRDNLSKSEERNLAKAREIAISARDAISKLDNEIGDQVDDYFNYSSVKFMIERAVRSNPLAQMRKELGRR